MILKSRQILRNLNILYFQDIRIAVARRIGLLLSLCLFTFLPSNAQFNVDRLLVSGQIALHYEDYVLSIQYFNQAILLKPYLYQPWQLRGVAKFYLDDFTGSEADATEAIRLNPYIDNIYDLRAITRIRQQKYAEAISDYTQAIRLNPTNRNYWFNRAICRMNAKDYAQAHADVDTIVRRWQRFANAYSLNAEIYLTEKDTTKAVKWLDKSLEIDPYDGNAWTTRAYISLNRRQWRDADKFLSKAIHLKPKLSGNYINRALARLNYNNLRGAMADYDTALDLDPENFLGHYNRGLLRMQLGDDNNAIEDFDYVIKMEPRNVIAIFNRAILHEKTGNLRAAIRDYSTVIDEFPNFWTGLSYRARCYRRLGMTAKAEMDEFRIFKAQMNKHIGIQPLWSRNKLKAMRKRSEIDPEKYNRIVVEDEHKTEQEYKSEYRGAIQNRNVRADFMPMYLLSYFKYNNGVKSYQAFSANVETFNKESRPIHNLLVTCNPPTMNEVQSKSFFMLIDTLSARINRTADLRETKGWLMQRAVAYSVLQDYDAAINDLNTLIGIDSTMAIAYWQRAACQSQMNEYNRSKGADNKLLAAKTKADFDRAVALDPHNAYIYYDRGNLHAALQQYENAIDDYTLAIRQDPTLAEAYYNRGIARLKLKLNEAAVADLSKAGELGLFDAYSVIKRSGKPEKK